MRWEPNPEPDPDPLSPNPNPLPSPKPPIPNPPPYPNPPIRPPIPQLVGWTHRRGTAAPSRILCLGVLMMHRQDRNCAVSFATMRYAPEKDWMKPLIGVPICWTIPLRPVMSLSRRERSRCKRSATRQRDLPRQEETPSRKQRTNSCHRNDSTTKICVQNKCAHVL